MTPKTIEMLAREASFRKKAKGLSMPTAVSQVMRERGFNPAHSEKILSLLGSRGGKTPRTSRKQHTKRKRGALPKKAVFRGLGASLPWDATELPLVFRDAVRNQHQIDYELELLGREDY